MRRILSLLALLFFCVGSPLNLVMAVDYYVSGAGDDANDGMSSATAFRTLTQAMSVAAVGDRVIVESGTFDQGAGETFPIAVVDGVSIEGPADSTAIVDGTSFGGAVFTVGAHLNPTSISGLTINAANNGIGLQCTGLPAVLAVQSNEFTGRDAFNNTPGGAVTPGGSSVVAFNDNDVTVSRIGVRWALQSVAAAHQLTISNNMVTGSTLPIRVTAAQTATGTAAVAVEVSNNMITPSGANTAIELNSIAPMGTVNMSLNVQNNTVTGGDIGVDVEASIGGGGGNISGLIAGNTVTSAQNGYMVDVDASNSAALVVGVDLNANNAEMCAGNGFQFMTYVEDNASITTACTIDCNTAMSNSAVGLSMAMSAAGSAVLTANPNLAYNYMGGNTTGLYGRAAAGGSAVFTGLATFRGNCIVGNTADGVFLTAASAGSPTFDFNVDFGGLIPGVLGRNTMSGNGAFDFNVSGIADSTGMILAEGNWWSGTTSTAIANGINDNNDNGNYPLVDFDPFLVDPLVITAGALTPGLMGVVNASPGSAFVQKAGPMNIGVDLDGEAGINPVVNATGTSVSFVVPATLTIGAMVTVTITNPCGQSGSIMVTITAGGGGGGGGGGCFVATAAYGDIESPEVRVLRQWRDDSLANNVLGRQVVKAYYAVSPGLAEAIADSPTAQAVTRAALTPFVGAVKLWMELPWLYALAGGALAWRLLRKRR